MISLIATFPICSSQNQNLSIQKSSDTTLVVADKSVCFRLFRESRDTCKMGHDVKLY
jgi:hypothetical protein